MANQGYIQITRKCNQHCRFCSNPDREETMEIDRVRGAVDEFVSRGYGHVIFSGGEPTLHDQLPEFISYAQSRGLPAKLITNAQKFADSEYIRSLADAGLNNVTVSIYSSRPETHDFLTEVPGSFMNIEKALENLERFNIDVVAATVINAYNADHLDETALWIANRFKNVRHFVWNNIDPHRNRATENPDTIPALADFELSLHKACEFLEGRERTFRVERVPLCYMVEYAHCSTETRKIVKGEERLTYFLDEKGRRLQTEFQYEKSECCEHCSLTGICVGLYDGGEGFDMRELHAVFVDPQPIIDKILL